MNDDDGDNEVKPLMVTQVDDDNDGGDEEVQIVAEKNVETDANTDLTGSSGDENNNDATSNDVGNDANNKPLYDTDSAIINVDAAVIDEEKQRCLSYPFPDNFPCPHLEMPTYYQDFIARPMTSILNSWRRTSNQKRQKWITSRGPRLTKISVSTAEATCKIYTQKRRRLSVLRWTDVARPREERLKMP